MRLKTSLGSSREVVQGCGVSFANRLYLVPIIIGQKFCATSKQGPEEEAVKSNGHVQVNLLFLFRDKWSTELKHR